ncbi:MAG TPA: molecular chaperone TorD family protein [Planctomycetota bacterium]|nr:molecular chaperone TorD family protein [Planctomycetota bacterium]
MTGDLDGSRDDLLPRSALWRSASALFRYPRPGAEAEVGGAEFWEAAERAARALAEPALADAVGRARRGFEGRDAASLEEEFVQAFGHTLEGSAPPYETLWGLEGSLLQPHAIADLAAFYRAHGLQIVPGGERPDHLSVECEFLHYLAFKEARARARGEAGHVETCRATRAEFLREHLGRFAPAFARRLRQASGDRAFGAAGDLLGALVRSEAASLEVRTGDEDLPLRTISFEDEGGCVSCPLAREAGRSPG